MSKKLSGKALATFEAERDVWQTMSIKDVYSYRSATSGSTFVARRAGM